MRRLTGIALVLVALGSGCGNLVGEVSVAGLAGASVDAAGDPSVVLYVCREDIDQVQVFADRVGLKETDENPAVASYTSDTVLDGLVELDLAEPGPGWEPSTPWTLEPERGYLISGSGSKDGASETSQLYLKTDDLADMTPGGIYVSQGDATLTRTSRADFVAQAKALCARDD